MALDGSEQSFPCPGSPSPWGNSSAPLPIRWETVWLLELVWLLWRRDKFLAAAENWTLATPTGIPPLCLLSSHMLNWKFLAKIWRQKCCYPLQKENDALIVGIHELCGLCGGLNFRRKYGKCVHSTFLSDSRQPELTVQTGSCSHFSCFALLSPLQSTDAKSPLPG
jgi:hypothetical protein